MRYGHVHVYNNHYIVSPEGYQYTWGAGVESRIFASHNAFRLRRGVVAADIIYDWGGTVIHADHTTVNGRKVDVLAAYNADHDPDLSPDAGWTPELHDRIDPVWKVPRIVSRTAGAGKLR